MYSLPNTHIQAADEPAAPVAPTTKQKRAVRPPKKEKMYPPLSLTNTKFGRFYTRTPSFERDEEKRLFGANADLDTDMGYKYGTRFKTDRPESGEIPIILDIPGPSRRPRQRAGSVGDKHESALTAPLTDIPKYWQERELPLLPHEMIECNAGKRESLSGSGVPVCNVEAEPGCHDAERIFSKARRRFTWSHSDDELREMNAALDYLLVL